MSEQQKLERKCVVTKQKIVYICSPLRGDFEANLQFAKDRCRDATIEGYLPLASHVYFTVFLDEFSEEERKLGMDCGLEMVKLCEELWAYRFQGISEGMQAEIDLAEELGIPVKYID